MKYLNSSNTRHILLFIIFVELLHITLKLLTFKEVRVEFLYSLEVSNLIKIYSIIHPDAITLLA